LQQLLTNFHIPLSTDTQFDSPFYTGSCHNSYVFSNMQIAQHPEKSFDQNQFLLEDSAYTSDRFTLPAYKGKELLDHKNVDFN
ncbi:hypothetical protein VP01_262g1, partial [Puccinia sorghi]